jgi:hypothetical protein
MRLSDSHQLAQEGPTHPSRSDRTSVTRTLEPDRASAQSLCNFLYFIHSTNIRKGLHTSLIMLRFGSPLFFLASYRTIHGERSSEELMVYWCPRQNPIPGRSAPLGIMNLSTWRDALGTQLNPGFRRNA